MRWVPHNWDWIKQFKEILVFGDYEHDSMTLLPDITARFLDTETKILAVRPEDYRGCKDANELLLKYGADAIRNAIKNAQPQMLEQVVRLQEVEYQDGDVEEKLPTGIREVDKVLTGGLPFGLMNILTGKRGEGKSTEGSMLVKSALENGYNCFIYSGEMKKGDVRKWLDIQIAGSNRVITENKGDYDVYRLSRQNTETIGNWYRDQAYIYDTSVVVETQKNLLDIIETYIKQFGCRFVLVDNLMTAIDLTDIGADKFERQELVCKRLARMAQKYNAMILLIAHKKKGMGYDENDDVLGSSEITNLAGVIMSYGRDSDIDDSERLLKVTKNRLTGRCLFDGVICGYDDASKRIFAADDPGAAARSSKCFAEEDSHFMNLPEDEEVPF
jgi:twinkle protein